ncbi:hypothetical protein GCM10017673_31970 [Streptosporangium violaceochromogenes]|nr:hypothetical protein GCM10017673_31970 [Streptosporangium violaceochromogenes]
MADMRSTRNRRAIFGAGVPHANSSAAVNLSCSRWARSATVSPLSFAHLTPPGQPVAAGLDQAAPLQHQPFNLNCTAFFNRPQTTLQAELEATPDQHGSGDP